MEFLFFLFLLGLAIPVVSFILPIVNFSRTSKIEKELEELKLLLKQKGVEIEKEIFEQEKKQIVESSVHEEEEQPKQPEGISSLQEKVDQTGISIPGQPKYKKQNTEALLLKIGALFVFLGVAWFVKYAVSIGLIGPYTLSLSVIFAAFIVLVYSFYDSFKNSKRASVLFALSSSVILGTLFVSTQIYHLFPVWFSFPVMISVAALSYVASYKFDNKALAGYSFALSALVPFLNTTQEPSSAGLLGYYLVLSVGTGALVYLKNWDFLQILNIVALVIYAMTASNIGLTSMTIFIAVFVFALNFLISQARLMQNPDPNSKGINLTLGIVLGLVTIALFADYFGFDSDAFKLLLFVFAVVYSFAGIFLFRNTKHYQSFLYNFGISLIYIFYLIVSLVKKPEIYMAFWPAFAFLFSVVSYAVSKKFVKSFYGSFLLIVPALYSLVILIDYNSFENPFWFTGSLVVYSFLMFALTYLLYFKDQIKENIDRVKDPVILLAIELILVLMAFIWRASVLIMPTHGLGVFLALTIYTLLGVLLYFAKFKEEKLQDYSSKKFSFALFFFVIGRILLIDVWTLDILPRIAVFVTIGALLIAVTYKSSYLKLEKNDEKNS